MQQYVATLKQLLFACQLEKFYELYLSLVASAWKIQDDEHHKLGSTDHEAQCIVKYELAVFTIRTCASGRLVWMASVERRPISQPNGFIVLTTSSEETTRKILEESKQKVDESGPFLKIERSEEHAAIY